MPNDQIPLPIGDRRQRSLVGEISASLVRRNSDRRYDRWSIPRLLSAVAILVGFVGVILGLARLALAV
jgi:hypothetical protein